ncbi:MAG: Y-family DNA polymerase [Pyrinomonadaceae bacterium]
MTLNALYVDFNSYFASVEQQLRPELRGRPVGVVPVVAETTCCIAASYEAKRFGVKTGTQVSDAKVLCPDIELVEARPSLYVQFHHRLVETIESCIHIDKVYSIDEVTCELTGSLQERSKALLLANHIKQKIAKTVGTELRCSIGIAPNTYLAKTAADMQKPDGCTVIDEPDLPECLFRLELSDLCGIGPRMKQRCLRAGISTVKQLCLADVPKLRAIWGGIEGARLHARLRGETVFMPETSRSTIGHSHVLPPELRNEKDAFSVISRLLQKTAVRLRSYGYVAGMISARVKYIDGIAWEDKIRFTHTDDTLFLLEIWKKMWKRRQVRYAPVPLKVSVSLFELKLKDHQLRSLFDNDQQRDALNSAIDSINMRFGRDTLYFGGSHSVIDSAPTRIAFTHIPKIE